jgi:hypothetical protein
MFLITEALINTCCIHKISVKTQCLRDSVAIVLFLTNLNKHPFVLTLTYHTLVRYFDTV